MIGKTISNYKILEKLGEGGMGVVYKAHDTKLGREIALKALPEEFAQDRERLARFEREAKLLASLNHPNIATIYGLEESEGLNFLTLELVEGDTLAGKLTSGPLKVQDALEMCRQIAEALESAHKKGIIHRDLKPSNIKVTPEGKIKVLDFGLAKAFEVAEVGDAAGMDPYKSPTMTVGSSRSGVIMGTAAYMSPEQARGKPLDKRTDIWSFGCVFYELLTGKQLFLGETTSDMVAGILKQEPDWKALPKELPVRIRDLLRRCLQKEPNKRLHDIADARIEIEETLSKPSEPTIESIAETEEIQPSLKKQAFPWGLTAIIAVTVAVIVSVAVWTFKPSPTPPPRLAKRFVVNLPPGHKFGGSGYGNRLALSPDGQSMVYSANDGEKYQLYLRPLDKLEATAIPGTENAIHPFFSPDGQQIGFFVEGRLKKVSLSGGNPLTICEADGRGATWSPEGNIIMGLQGTGLMQVSSSEGIPRLLTTLDKENGETSHRYPQIVPGGKAVLFTVRRESGTADSRIAVCSLETGEHRILFDETGFDARYVSSGHIVYLRAGVLMAVPFDVQELKVRGSPVPLAINIHWGSDGNARFSISSDGTIVYFPLTGEIGNRSLIWVDRKGIETPIAVDQYSYRVPRISPDGKKVAVSKYEGENYDIWVYDVERGTLTRLTFEGDNNTPAWTPDGRRLLFCSNRTGDYDIYSKKADGSDEAELFFSSENLQWSPSLSGDGESLTFYEIDPETQRDVWTMQFKDKSASPLINTSANERAPAFSPDGRWVAYMSDESGRWEVFVTPYPKADGKWQISTDGGIEPVWSPDGRELFYREKSKMMAVSIETSPSFKAGKPKMLFEKMYYSYSYTSSYDIHPDGNRFLMIEAEEEPDSNQISIVLNWDEELKRLVPVDKR